jgi:RHS repeat-associated protein
MHDANGLYYMRARYYHPELKRFLNRDVLKGDILEGQTLNRYAYVNGDPVSYVDPLGLEKQLVKSTSVGSGNALNRNDSGLDHTPMEAEKFNRMKNAFEKKGGLIVKEEEALPLLNYHGVEASTLDATTIAFRPNPSASAVFEEFIHATQYRTGRANGTNIIEMEIEAKEKLIKFRKAYEIPNSETRDTIQQLRQYRQMLQNSRW